MSSKYFISASGIFNADSRKSIFKSSGLRWFLVFEDLCNREGSLQANKTSKKHFSYLSKKKESCNKSVKLYFYYSTQKDDDSITTLSLF